MDEVERLKADISAELRSAGCSRSARVQLKESSSCAQKLQRQERRSAQHTSNYKLTAMQHPTCSRAATMQLKSHSDSPFGN
jgi:hypothetical protein